MRIDPDVLNENIFAESFTIDMNNDYSIADINRPEQLDEDDQNILLKPYDYIYVRPDPFFSAQKIMNISGMVHYPGDYVILILQKEYRIL